MYYNNNQIDPKYGVRLLQLRINSNAMSLVSVLYQLIHVNTISHTMFVGALLPH